MPKGSTIIVNDASGNLELYAPRRGEPADQFTVMSFGSPNAVHLTRRGPLLRVSATVPNIDLLLRSPQDSNVTLHTGRGSINVADAQSVVNAGTDHGDITMMIPQYGNATIGTGNMTIIFGAKKWPGTLHFSDGKGDVEIYVNENAKARVHLHTADGTIFTDFNLRGQSSGNSETIDAPINGGAKQSIDVEVGTGTIRLLQLKPQV